MRTPAPVALVYVPARWAVRRIHKKRAAAKVAARHEARTTELLERQAERLGVTVNESVAVAEPTPGIAFEVAAGEQLEAARSWLYNHRRDVLAPVGVAAVLVILRLVVHLARAYTWTDVAIAAVPALAVLGAGAWWVMEVDPRGVSPSRKRAAGLTVFAALLWLLAPVSLQVHIPSVTRQLTDAGPMFKTVSHPRHLTLLPTVRLSWLDGPFDFLPGWPLTYVLLVLATAVAVKVRWGRFRPRAAVQPPSVGPAEIWAATMGAEGPLTGTTLTNLHRVITQAGDDVGWQADVLCVQGKHNVTKVTGQREDIAGAYGRDMPDVAIERTGNALRGRLTLIERDPFPKVLEPKVGLSAAGISIIGSYIDGDDAPVRLYTPGAGSHDTWGFGVKGAGKSVFVDNVLGSWMSRGLVVLHMTDLKGGMSLSHWAEIAYRYGTKAADGLMMLRRLDAIGAARMEAAAKMKWFAPGDPKERTGVPVLEPSEEWPIHLGVIEEAPQLWRIPEAVEIAERIITLYRAVLVPLFAISQMCELKQAWGNSATLRTQIQGGNVWCGYVPKEQAKLGFDHFKPDLTLIEKGSWKSYVTSPVQSREALLKVARIGDSWQVSRSSIPGVPNAIDAAAVQEFEDRVAADEKRREEAVKQGKSASIGGAVSRSDVETAALTLAQEAGTTTTGAVAAATGDKDNTSHYDRVRNVLKQLAEDPASPLHSPGHGKWAA